MRRTSGAYLSTAVCLVTGLGLSLAAPHQISVRGQGQVAKHHELFPRVPPKTIQIYDPRFAVERVRYAPIKGRVVLEGDMVLGTIEEVEKRARDHAARLAARIVADPETMRSLPAEQQEALRKLASQAKEDLHGDGLASADAERAVSSSGQRTGQAAQDTRFQGAVLRSVTREFRWPDGVIPYIVAGDFPDPDRIDKAIAHWHSKTDRIRIIRRDLLEPRVYANYVRFVRSTVCQSWVGKRTGGLEQDIELAPDCLVPQVIHEIAHAVGLFHEQSRSDRDDYLTLKTENIAADALYNFDLNLRDVINIGPFDFQSIMLYPPGAFSANGQPVMLKNGKRPDLKPDDLNWGIASGSLGGVTTELSEGDVEAVSFMYPDPSRPKLKAK